MKSAPGQCDIGNEDSQVERKEHHYPKHKPIGGLGGDRSAATIDEVLVVICGQANRSAKAHVDNENPQKAQPKVLARRQAGEVSPLCHP